MVRTLAAPPDAGDGAAARAPSPAPLLHVLAAGWVGGMLSLGVWRPEVYEGLLQEDHFVEWWTVTLFGAAGVLALARAWRGRRPFDALVGAFCVFVAGEEFSWGQRLLGLTPPDAFLEHNRQQELTLHNFADLFGEPRWVLILALAGFGLVLPAVATSGAGRRLLARIGATVPALPTAVWIVAAAALLLWYPLTLTGEWVEALAGSLFLVSFAPRGATAAGAAGAGALLAAALALLSGTATGGPAEIACARLETRSVADALAYGSAATGRLAGARSVHKRLFTAIEEGYVRPEGLGELRALECGGDPASAERRAYGLDPWGTAYWIHLERGADTIRLSVYSFGPNRRRDDAPGGATSDDIVAPVVITL